MEKDLRPYLVRIQSGENQGTGFFIGEDGYILTCSHVVQESREITFYCYNTENQNFDKEYRASVVFRVPEDEGDIALLKSEEQLNYNSLPLMTCKGSVFNDFYSYGFPESNPINGTSATGEILGEKQSENGKFPLFEFRDNAVLNGFSGCPVVDKNYWGIIGMGKAYVNGENRQTEVNFAVTADFIYEKTKNHVPNLKLLPAKSVEKRLYEQKLKEMYEQTDTFNQNIALKDLYVEPYFLIHKNCLKGKSNKYDREEYQLIEKSLPENIHSYIRGDISSGLDENLKKSQLILLFGHPGQGKSSFCKRLLFDILNKQLYPNKNLFFLKLREIKKVENLKNAPLESLLEEIKKEVKIQAGFKEVIITEKEFSNAIVILDGLDELEMVAAFNEDDVLKFCQNMVDELARGGDTTVIITSRHGRISAQDIISKKVLIFQLASSTPQQQKRWLHKFTKKGGETWLTPEKIDEFNQKKNKHIRELIEQPILLSMVALLKKPIDEATNRSQIYDNLFTTIIDRPYDTRGKLSINDEFKLNPEDLRQLIREIAFTIFQNNREYVHKDQLAKALSPKLQEFFKEAQNNHDKKNLLRRMMMSFYMPEVLKTEDDDFKPETIKSDYAIEFLHKSLQEYMAAEYIWHTVFNQLVDKSSMTKEYFIKDSLTVSRLFHEIFSQQFLSSQITEYLIQIILSKPAEERQELGNRLEHFFIPSLENDFLSEYSFQTSAKLSPIQISQNTFAGFWTLLSYSKDSLKDFFLFREKKSFAFERFIFQLSHPSIFYLRLRGANLREIDLRGTDLREADLREADLRGADLRGANLSEANLSEAKLSGAKLSGAKLLYEQKMYAERKGAIFTY